MTTVLAPSNMTKSLLFTLIILLYTSYCHAFPGLLVERASGCMLDLSTEEVIMNNQVVAFVDSSHPDIRVVVKHEDDWIPGPVKVESLPSTYTVKLETSLKDVQYAIETTEGAKFTSGAFGCEGRRSSSRTHNDPGVELTIESLEKIVKVWAGWATGHEAVQLTDYLVFVKKDAADNVQDDVEKAALLAEEQRKQMKFEQHGDDIETGKGEKSNAEKARQTDGAKTRMTNEDKDEEDGHHFALPKSGILNGEERTNQRAKKTTNRRAHRLPPKETFVKKKLVEEALPKKGRREKRQQHGPLYGYEKDSYTPNFDMMQFMYGIVFFVGTMFALLLVLESGIGRPNKRKGNRDL